MNATLNGVLIPLHLAARYNRFHSVEMLLAAGADVNACTRDGSVPHLWPHQKKPVMNALNYC